jgi:hypothetical protein
METRGFVLKAQRNVVVTLTANGMKLVVYQVHNVYHKQCNAAGIPIAITNAAILKIKLFVRLDQTTNVVVRQFAVVVKRVARIFM